MLRSGCPSVRTPLSGPARTGPAGLITLCVSHPFSQKYLPITCCFASCARCCRLPCNAPHLAPCSPPIKRCAPSRAAPPPSSCRALSPTVPTLARCAPRLRCCAPCPVPRAHRGAADATVPHQKVVAAVDAMAAVMRDLRKEMLR
jgi:hypothetical protein